MLLLAVIVPLMWVAGSRGDTWRQHTFEDFRKGHADDGGVNLYAAPVNRTNTSNLYRSEPGLV